MSMGLVYSPIVAEAKLAIEDFSLRWLPMKLCYPTFPFVFIIMKDLASINQVDNRLVRISDITARNSTSHAKR